MTLRTAPIHDLTGKRFGRLTVSSFVGFNEARHSVWICHCDCGETITAFGYSMKQGKKKSCGCLQREWVNKNRSISETSPGKRRVYLREIVKMFEDRHV